MISELQFFEHEINERLSCTQNKTVLPESEYHSTLAAIEKETEETKLRIMKTSANMTRQKKAKRYVCHQQDMILHLSNRLMNQLEEEIADIYQVDDEPSCLNLSKRIYKSLEELLLFLEKNFKQHIDIDKMIPEVYHRIASREIREKERNVRSTLLHRGINEELLSVVLEPAQEFITNPRSGISIRQLLWVKELLKEMEALPKRDRLRYDLEKELILLVCYLNLNTVNFYKYCIERCKQVRNDAKDPANSVAALERLLTFVQQFEQKVDFSYRPKQKPIKAMMENWLTREIAYLSRQTPTARQETKADIVASEEEQATLGMTITEFGYLVCLMAETSLIKVLKVPGFLRLFSRLFIQMNGLPVMASSMESRYYSAQASTTKAVRKHLKNMYDYSLKYHEDGKCKVEI